MRGKDIYDFYAEISFIKIVLWVFFTFLWLIMTFLLTDPHTGWFDGLIERTNIYFFYTFWLGLSVTAYIFLYVNAYKKNKKIIKSFSMCFGTMILMLLLSWCSVKVSALSYKHFSSDTWKECKHTRKYMIADLINNHNLIGMEINEAIRLLGEPDSYFDSQISNDQGIIYYSGRNTYIITFYTKNNKIDGYTIYNF